MSYKQQSFQSGQVFTAAAANAMDQALVDQETAIASLQSGQTTLTEKINAANTTLNEMQEQIDTIEAEPPAVDEDTVRSIVDETLESNTIDGLYYPDNLVLVEEDDDDDLTLPDIFGFQIVNGALCQTYKEE